MKRLLHKELTKKGFTLAELLIVVAILAILVAVSIPIFTSQLDKAKKSTDEANLRACKALVANAILTDEFPNTQWADVGDKTKSANYDAENGCLVLWSNRQIKKYGQGSGICGETNAQNDEILKNLAQNYTALKDSYLTVYCKPATGEYVIAWSN